jgi:hypothetical protein
MIDFLHGRGHRWSCILVEKSLVDMQVGSRDQTACRRGDHPRRTSGYQVLHPH